MTIKEYLSVLKLFFLLSFWCHPVWTWPPIFWVGVLGKINNNNIIIIAVVVIRDIFIFIIIIIL